MRVGIRVLSPVRKDMQSVKLITMKSEKLFHFPANIEFLRDIVYELYVMWDSNKLDELETRLKDRTPVYTPCVGVTEHVAKLDFICRCDAVNIQKVDRVDSIIPVRFVNNIVFENCDIFMDNIPITNNKKREYIAYEKVMFAFSGDKNCKIIGDIYGDMFKIGDKNIYLF
jgi:CRISPR-associated protein Cas5h